MKKKNAREPILCALPGCGFYFTPSGTQKYCPQHRAIRPDRIIEVSRKLLTPPFPCPICGTPRQGLPRCPKCGDRA